MAAGQDVAGIEPGAPADLVVLGADDPMLAGHNDDSRLDALIFSGYPLPLERVMVAGDWRVIDGTHVQRDFARSEFLAAIENPGGAS